MDQRYIRQRGETITISLVDSGATAPGAPFLTSYARPWSEILGTFDLTRATVRFLPAYRPSDATFGPGWTISLDAGNCAAMDLGLYRVDLKIIDGLGGAIITEPSWLTIVEPATQLPAISPITPSYPTPSGSNPFVGTRLIAWIGDAPLDTVEPAAIVGPPGVGMPPGGTTGQVLAKASNADYATDWVTGGGGGGSGTVTSVAALTLGTSGSDLSSTVANPTTTPVITLNVPTASAGARGVLSAADWSAFNAKQPAFTSQTANRFYAAPDGVAGVPTFRAIVPADVPTLNQSTTGSAATLTTPRTITATGDIAWSTSFNGSANVSAAATLATVNSNVGTFGSSTLVPVVTVNAKGLVTGVTTAAIGGGTVTSVGGVGTVSGLSLSGTVTSTGNLTLGGTLAVLPSNFASQTANTVLAAPFGAAGVPTFRALVAADIPTLNQNTTGTADNVTGIVAVANGGTGTATPSLVGGTNVTISGTWPNQTIAASGGGSPGGANTQVQFNDGGVFGGDAGLTYNKTTDALTIGGTLTALGNVTGANITIGGGHSAFRSAGNGVWLADTSGNTILGATGTQVRVPSNYLFGFSSASGSAVNGSLDVVLARQAAGHLFQRNGTNAQTFSVAGTYTDASNYRSLTATMTTAGVATLRPEGAGTGASGNVLGVYHGTQTVAQLATNFPSPVAGLSTYVNDSTLSLAAGIGTAVIGGGSNTVRVGYDGTNWLIGG